MNKICIYYVHEGKRVHIKDFTNISDMFHWCELNCKRDHGNYYMHGNKLMCSDV